MLPGTGVPLSRSSRRWWWDKTRKAPGAANSGRLDISTMSKVLPPATPVKSIGAPVVGAEEAAPFIERWLATQRAHLGEALAVGLSRAEVLLALSLLTATDERGQVFMLSGHLGRNSIGMTLPVATGANGLRLFPSSFVKPGEGRSFRVSFRITSDYMSGVVQIDAVGRRLTEPQMSARYERNLRLARSGLVQMTFMEDEVIADPDACAVQVFGVFGIDVKPMVRP